VSTQSFDVAIIGGGPAGCATALSLQTHAPSLSIAVIEASRYDAVRIGETLPPAVRPVLEHLGVWDAFIASEPRAVHGTSAAWGTAVSAENDFLYMARGPGWHLDRADFDAMLASETERRGVTLLRDTNVQSINRDDGWTLSLMGGNDVRARFLVDATGSAARFARRCGAHIKAGDQLVGFARFFDDAHRGDGRTVVESFEDGWWYTAGLPGGRRIAACFTDADLGRRMLLSDPETWQRKLETMPLMGTLLRVARPSGKIIVRPSSSHCLDVASGDDWLAVGDAASTFDPLSSQGLLKALRGGIFASYAIGDSLTRHDHTGLQRYRSFIRAEYASYEAVRTTYYQQEQRWPESPFWERRQEVGQPEPQRHRGHSASPW
jgi:2-polyprenyl-6-methoxyphenol hydroxylase-like FAD-dependent oxidoreductase